MRGHGFVPALLFMCSALAHASSSSTLRVGNQVLSVGDSAARVQELLGRPAYKSHGVHAQGRRNKKGRRGGGSAQGGMPAGERWQYRRGDHTTTVTIVDGKVADIEDRRS